ncbi:putative nucleoside-diphosphate sugar epimerase [Galbibacter orientalis DSM 19592]|uniref:Putative nucleoside-diphosphate sugar epimerase n=1 Tax=Galbibacter orientalis DSM 19592 TaxID=926559 RepID=I3C780_9FLAO|nr:nucleoside-diphosphate sugar epimerase/dehydratase [Galbibacter orientalis]EIJ39473.1 putative nucleoside-diphosphate sugar epimerase [Galbibacter orientalis DSM 19592]
MSYNIKDKLDLSKLGFLPRWGVFFIDVCICLVALVLSMLVAQMDKPLTQIQSNLNLIVLTVLIVNSSAFIIFRTYAGLIRHSGFIDAIRILLAAIFTFIVVMAVNYGFYFKTNAYLMPRSFLILYFLISFSLLFVFRIATKQFFEFFIKSIREKDSIKVLIYGINSNAVSVASALKSESPSRFHVVGFITDEKKNTNKRILGEPIIYLSKRISVLMRFHKAQGVILTDNSISLKKKNKIVEDCIQNNMSVFMAPLVSDVEDEKVSSKIEAIQIEDLLPRKAINLNISSILKDIEGKRVLITGGAGSIGSEIARQIALFNPEKLYVLDQAETPLHSVHLELANKHPNLKLEVVLADIRNKDRITCFFKSCRPHVIFHAAAYKHVPLIENNPTEAALVNIEGTKHLADLALKFQAEKFVMISTDKAVNPTNIMGASKRIAEMYVQSLYYKAQRENPECTKFITTRFGNVLGSNGSVVPLFKEQISKGGPVTITHPEIIRYFMTIPEACQLVIEAGRMGRGGEIFLFDMGDPVKILDLAKKMIRLAGYTPDKEIKIKITGLRPGEKLFEELLSDKERTMQTHHEKIMIGKVYTDNYNLVDESISSIVSNARNNRIDSMIIAMKKLVPEYKSQNSIYESFDVKLKTVFDKSKLSS